MILFFAWLLFSLAMYAIGCGMTNTIGFLNWPIEFKSVYIVGIIVGAFVVSLARNKKGV